jgi:CrcB protein
MKEMILAGLGGGIGSMLRYLTSVITAHCFRTHFPLATLFVNLSGCLIIGLLTGLFERHQSINPEMKLLLMTGFCGGFTTFSAFSAENLRMLQTGHTALALCYMAVSLLAGLSAVWAGWMLTRPA